MGNLSAFAFVCLCAGAALACGGGDGNGGATSGGGSGGTGGATGGTGGGTGATGGGTGATGGTGGSAPACDGPGYGTSDAPHLVNKFNAKVVDQDGNAAADMLAQVCGTDICINAKTDATGTVVTCVSGTGTCTAGIQPNKEITRPAFKYGDGTTFAKFAYLLPTTSSDYDIGTHMTIKLPAIGTGGDLTPGSTATSGSISLVLAADAVIEIDELVFDTPDLHKFRAIEVPIAKAPAAVDPALGFGMVVATTPIETHICPAAKLTVPNTPGWAAGTEVEIWYHGVDPGEAWAPYAHWAKMSGGKVSADGKTISTNDGEGVSELSIFGIRKK